MHTKSLTELSIDLIQQKLSSTELTQHFLERIDLHRQLNAFITVDAERALDQARAADRRLGRGTPAPLTGIPIAHKDIFCTEGMLTSCGSRILSNFVSPYNATMIEKLRQQDTVILGKTNMDEFAMGSSNETSYYGPVANPWDESRVPGGSSGGSAAAVSAGLAPAATGTDTGGSIRQPASFCGVTGFKPSYGRVSRYGMVAFASSLDQAGPLTRSAQDAALLLQATAGFDPRDSTSVDRETPDYTATLTADISGLKIGLPKQYFGQGLDGQVELVVREALAHYEALGARLMDVDLPNSALCVPCYYVLAPSEASSNLSRFDGVRYGYRTQQYDDLTQMYAKTRAEGFGAEVKRRIMIGTYALSAGYYDAYYLKAQKLRRLIADDFRRAFEQCDVIMGPTTPTTAFTLGEKTDDPIAMYLNDIYTISANLAGLPAISIPAGLSGDGMPVGLHIIGRYFDEPQILNFAHRLQMGTDWHRRSPPGYTS